jgi:hypothetical protein
VSQVLEINLEESDLDATGRSLIRRHIENVLADVTCPDHSSRLEAVHLAGQWPNAMQLELTGCCDALRAAARRALGLSAEEKAARKTDEWEIAAVSSLATKIAELFSRRSIHGRPHDPPLHVSVIRQATNASDEELIAAVKELESLHWVVARRVDGAEPFGYNIVVPTDRLFERLDQRVIGSDPAKDAVRVARELVTGDQPGLDTRVLAERLEWEPRRLNPALSYLLMNDLAQPRGNVDRLYVTPHVAANARTRQFAKGTGG